MTSTVFFDAPSSLVLRVMDGDEHEVEEGVSTAAFDGSVPPKPSDFHRLAWSGVELVWLDVRSLDEKATAARQQRDTLLAASDWLVTRALERGELVPPGWAAYRQALRDITEQAGFPGSIEWPVPPG